MTYTLNNKLTEANAVYKICEAVRGILNNELHVGKPRDEIIKKLIGFYRSMSPRMADHLEAAEPLWQFDHLASVLSSKIYIHLGVDEVVDFVKVKAFLNETWPTDEVVNFNAPEQVSYISMGGKEFGINPRVVAVGKTAETLLEKMEPGARMYFNSTLVGPSDAELKTVDSGPITYEQIQQSAELLKAMDEGTKHALYRYWHRITHRDERIELTWTHFGTFAMWAMENGYQMGYRLQRDVLEEGYVIGNVKWAPVKPGIPMTDRAGNRVFDEKKDGQE